MDYSARTRYRPPPLLYQRVQKRLGPFMISHGVGPRQVVVLEVPGRRSGKIRRNALVKTSHNGDDYLVALAGESEWVCNGRAADGHVVIGRRQRRAAHLEEVPPAERPPNTSGVPAALGPAAELSLPCSAKLGCSSGSAVIHRWRIWLRSPSSTPCFGLP